MKRNSNYQKYMIHEDFYKTKQWKQCKSIIRQSNTIKCLRCNSLKDIQVDHIKPKSKYPKLIFDINNLQLLCKECNFNKSNMLETDYRDEVWHYKLNKYLKENKINRKAIKYSLVVGRLVFKYPKDYVLNKRKKVKTSTPKKKTASKRRLNKRSVNTNYINEKKDPKIDIKKLLELQNLTP